MIFSVAAEGICMVFMIRLWFNWVFLAGGEDCMEEEALPLAPSSFYSCVRVDGWSSP